jgi:hypothetical protein
LPWKTRVSVFTPLESVDVVISELSGAGRVVVSATALLLLALAFVLALDSDVLWQAETKAIKTQTAKAMDSFLITLSLLLKIFPWICYSCGNRYAGKIQWQ